MHLFSLLRGKGGGEEGREREGRGERRGGGGGVVRRGWLDLVIVWIWSEKCLMDQGR